MDAAVPAQARPLRRDAERNRVRIMEAARTVFAERGLTVTMDEIARCAGVGVGTVYRRFPTREQLVDALFEHRMAQLLAAAEDAAQAADAWEGLVAFLDGWLTMQAEDRGLKDVLLSTAHGKERVRRVREQLAPMLTGLVERARREGTLRGDFEGSDVALVGVMVGAVGDYTDDVAPDVWRRCLTFVLDGLRARREAPSPLPAEALSVDQLDCAMAAWRPRGRPRRSAAPDPPTA